MSRVPSTPAGKRTYRLTSRQAEVARLVVRGHTNEQIAKELGITERGVRAQVSRLLKRFDARNRTGLAHALLATNAIGAMDAPHDDARVQPQVAIPPEHEAQLYDHAPFMVAVLSAPDLRITYANARFASALGWRAEQLIGKSYADIFFDAPPERVAARHRAARHGELKAVDRGQTRWRREDGTTGMGVLTYMVHPLWTMSGNIDELLFIGTAHSSSAKAPLRDSKASAAPRSKRSADTKRRSVRAILRVLAA